MPRFRLLDAFCGSAIRASASSICPRVGIGISKPFGVYWVGSFAGIMTSVPPSIDVFDGIRLKIARAEKHLHTLKSSLRAVIEGDQDTGIEIKIDANDNWEAIANVSGDALVDPLWPILIGEILYQLRSSLDHVINAVATPTKDTNFPVRDDETSFDNDTFRQLPGISTMDRTITKLFQPFELHPTDPRDSTPWALNELANLDRHRALHTSSLWLTEESRVAFIPPGCGTIDYSMNIPGPIEQGAVIASGKLLRTPRDPEVAVQVFGVPNLVLTSINAYRGPHDLRGIYVTGLRAMVTFAYEVVAAFENPLAFLAHEGTPGQSP